MAKINPSKYKTTYENQEKELASFQAPPTGVYHAVNVALQHQIVGAKKTKKMRVRAHILKAIESEENKGGDFVGKTCGLDFWEDYSKDMNLKRVVVMGIACGHIDEWDPEDRMDQVKVLTGVPYILHLKNEETEYQGKVRQELTVVEVKSLGQAEKKKYMELPDWSKIVGAPKDRMLKDEDYSERSSGGGGKKEGHSEPQASGDPFRDDDIR